MFYHPYSLHYEQDLCSEPMALGIFVKFYEKSEVSSYDMYTGCVRNISPYTSLFLFPPPWSMIFENKIASTKTRSERHLMIRQDGIIECKKKPIIQERFISGRKSGLESRFAMTFV